MRIVETVVAVNDARKKAMAGRVTAAVNDETGDNSLKGKTVAVLGLTFKPNTDDMRDSASLELVPSLLADGATLRVYDPEGMAEAKKLLTGDKIVWCENAYDTMKDADALVILTEWNEFRSLNLDQVKSLLRQPVIVDLRNIYSPAEMTAAGFRYTSLGRPSTAL